MITAVDSPSLELAFRKSSLRPRAVHVVQPDGALSLAKVSPPWGRNNHPTVQLPAHHRSIWELPAVITHGSPLLVVEHFHSPSTTAWAVHQPDWGKAGNSRACEETRNSEQPLQNHPWSMQEDEGPFIFTCSAAQSIMAMLLLNPHHLILLWRHLSKDLRVFGPTAWDKAGTLHLLGQGREDLAIAEHPSILTHSQWEKCYCTLKPT